MDTSKTRSSKNPTNQGERQEIDQVHWPGGLSTKRMVRVFLSVESASFFLAAVIHAGVLIRGYGHQEAMIAESVIGAVLLVGLAMTWVRPGSMSLMAVGVQAFALLGTFVGIWTIIVGIGPRTVPDIVYHAVIVLVLTIGLVLAWRSRGTGAA